jgi:general secretion pathway protein A
MLPAGARFFHRTGAADLAKRAVSWGLPVHPNPIAPISSADRLVFCGRSIPPASRNRIPKDHLMSGSDYFAQHFGLTERPFTLLPDPEFLYWSPAHKRAFSVLEYGVMTRAPITVITGEVGAGKTTLLQQLLKNFDETTVVGLISNAQGGRGELLQWVLNALDVPFEKDAAYVSMFQTLQDFVIGQYAEGNHVVLVIDEAQNLSIEGLEELRMLTNINSNKDELLQLILVGQPELLEMIRLPELRQFAQRVTASFHISALDAESARAYIRHRLEHAAGSGEEFTDAAIDLIWEYSRGIPRLINKLADFSMVYAITSDKTQVDEDTVREVLNDNIFIETFDPAEAAE